MFENSILYVKDLSFSYKTNVPVLKRVNFFVNTHEIVCIVGPNGAGKSTLLKAFAGIIDFEGEIFFKGNEITNFKDYKKKVAYIPSLSLLYEILTGNENLELIRNLWNVRADLFWKNVKYFSEKLDLSLHLESRVEEYSMGMKDKLFFIAHISREPEIILLDEPFLTWDDHSQQTILQLLIEYVEQKEVAVVFVTHSEQLRSKLANRVYKLENGVLQKYSAPEICDRVIK